MILVSAAARNQPEPCQPTNVVSTPHGADVRVGFWGALADIENKLQKSVAEWTRRIENTGMEINQKKSKVMLVSKKPEGKRLRVECKEEALETVTEYNYLGTIIYHDGRIDREITNRVRKATNSYYVIYNTIFGKKEIEKRTKTRIYESVIEPSLLYGCESWPTQQKHLSKVNAVQMKVLRKIEGKTRRDRIRNTRIRSELKQKPVEEKITSKQ